MSSTDTARGWRLRLHSGQAVVQPGAFQPEDLAACLEIRTAVFVEEQRVSIEHEMDGRDGEALHVLLRADERPIATARLLLENDLAHIGRVAVLADQRGRGAGRALMAALPALLPAQITTLELNAQSYAIGFYQRLGYIVEGEEFMEENIPHIAMVRRVAS